MTAEFVAAGSGVVLSLLFSYIPGFASWYGQKEEDQKRLIMLGLLALFSLGAFGVACSGYASEFGITVPCTDAGAVVLLKAFFVAAVANQTTYKLSPKSKSRAYGRGVA